MTNEEILKKVKQYRVGNVLATINPSDVAIEAHVLTGVELRVIKDCETKEINSVILNNSLVYDKNYGFTEIYHPNILELSPEHIKALKL